MFIKGGVNAATAKGGNIQNEALKPSQGSCTSLAWLWAASWHLNQRLLMSISQTSRVPLCQRAVSDRGDSSENLEPPLAEQVYVCKWTDCSASNCLLVELHRSWVLWAGAVIATGATEIFTCLTEWRQDGGGRSIEHYCTQIGQSKVSLPFPSHQVLFKYLSLTCGTG